MAGGKASRMGGRDKGELDINGTRMFDMVLERLSPQIDEILISGTHDYGSGFKILPDLPEGPEGPSAALFAAITAMPEIDGFMTVPIDGPFFPSELYERLSENGSAIAVGPEREHPTFAYWTISDLMSVFGMDPKKNWALIDIARHVDARKVAFRAESYFMNFNAPEDFDLTFQ